MSLERCEASWELKHLSFCAQTSAVTPKHRNAKHTALRKSRCARDACQAGQASTATHIDPSSCILQVDASTLDALTGAELADRTLPALDKLLSVEKDLVGKKSLYVRLGSRGDWCVRSSVAKLQCHSRSSACVGRTWRSLVPRCRRCMATCDAAVVRARIRRCTHFFVRPPRSLRPIIIAVPLPKL